MAISIRCAAEELSETRPALGLRPRVDHEQVGLVVDDRRDGRAERAGERLRGLARAAVAVADRDDLRMPAPPTRSARSTGAIATAVRPPSSRRSAELPTATWPLAVCESEQNTITSAPSLRGERREALRRGAVGDDVARGARVAEQLGAAVEQLLRLGLRERLTVAVGLVRVADVCERDLRAGLASRRPRAIASSSLAVPS